MRETDKIPVLCTQCGQDSRHQIGWLKRQTMLACPLCGYDVTGQIGQALMNIGEAERITAEDLARLKKDESYEAAIQCIGRTRPDAG